MRPSLRKYQGTWRTKEERQAIEDGISERIRKLTTKPKGMNKSKVYSATYSSKV